MSPEASIELYAQARERAQRRAEQRRIEARIISYVASVEEVLEFQECFERFGDRIGEISVDDEIEADRQRMVVVAPGFSDQTQAGRRAPAAWIGIGQPPGRV